MFCHVTWGGIQFKGTDVLLVQGMAHYEIVKVGNHYSKTQYTHLYPSSELLKEIYAATEELSRKEIIKLRHHMTRRIWINDGVFECINWQNLQSETQPHWQKLLPPEMCFDCLKEGNKYIPLQLKTHKIGVCRCCGRENINLHRTRLGWPCDLRHKGFGFTCIMEGINYKMNAERYKRQFDMSIYADYNG